MDKVVVYIINTNLIKQNLDKVLNFVSKNRKEKALKLVQEKDKFLSLGGAYLMKKYLPREDIKKSKAGKPYIEEGPSFSLSHSGEFAVLAVHPTKEIGVDIERIDESKLNALRYTLSKEERAESDLNNLFRMWSNKESLIKCIGSSLSDIKKVPGLPLNGERRFKDKTYFSNSQLYKDYSLSFTIEGNKNFLIVLEEIEKI